MVDDNEVIGDLIHSFNVNCEAKGHYFKPSPINPGFDYCEACGASRPTQKEPSSD